MFGLHRSLSSGRLVSASVAIEIVPAVSSFDGAWAKDEQMTLKQIVHSDPEILGGTPVFVGTRVPVRILLDYLEGGEPLEEFLDNYPSVSREQAVAFIEEASRVALTQIA